MNLTYRTGETPRRGDIFTIYALSTEYSKNTSNQWKILDISFATDTMTYQSMLSNTIHSGQKLSDVKMWYLFKSGEREKSGFGKFLARIEAKPKKKPLPF